jgi:DNA-binding NarL/FixJ family response regulator
MKNLRIILADDHALVRAGLRALLHEMGVQVLAEAGNGWEVLQRVAELQPDVVLMDIAMPELNGLEATARLTQEFPNVRVVILSMHANVEYARRAIQAGAVGYLLKNAKAAELETALTAVAQGEVYLSPAVAKFVAADYTRRSQDKSPAYLRLTPRQAEILKLITKGYTRKQIAEKLDISVKTFDTYRAQLMQLLDVQDAAGLVRVAAQQGLVAPGE